MNGFISTFLEIKELVEIFIVIYGARRSAGSATGAMTGVEYSRIE
jgi:hypothetical protein